MEKGKMNLQDFIYLLLATLAKKNLLIDFRNRNIKTAVLPLNYKEVIEEILCAGNGWKDEFSIFIDTDEYFKDHFQWEKRFTEELINVVNALGKKMEYDLEFDRIIIKFSDKEINNIMDRYNFNNNVIENTMDHFCNLLNDFIFTRRYKEEFIPHINVVGRNVEEINKYNGIDVDESDNSKVSILLKKARRR